MKRLMLVPAFSLAALALTASARAQSSGWLDQYRPSYADQRQSYYDARRVAYDYGYREGLKEGEKDARKRDVYRVEDEKAWQHADKGYRREYGDLERYRQAFRSGFSYGYADSYRQYAPNYDYGRYGNGPWNNGRYGQGPVGTYGYPDTRQYPDRYPGQYGGYNVASPAYDTGARDGYDKGVEDARKGRSFDPRRQEWYREADRHYEGRYGSKDVYRDVYREGFMAGYERGYRGGAYR